MRVYQATGGQGGEGGMGGMPNMNFGGQNFGQSGTTPENTTGGSSKSNVDDVD